MPAMNELAAKQCIPCAGGVDPLAGGELSVLLAELSGGWEIVDGHHLVKTFKFGNFVDALAWVNKPGALAEEPLRPKDLEPVPPLHPGPNRLSEQWFSASFRPHHPLDPPAEYRLALLGVPRR